MPCCSATRKAVMEADGGVTLLHERSVGALQVLDGLVGVSGPVGSGGEEREPFTAEHMSIIGAGQDLVGLGPRMSLECPPPRDHRVVGWCNHVRILRRWPFRSADGKATPARDG